jgi:hypothetical protein
MIETVHELVAFYKEIVDLLCNLESIPSCVDEGDAAPSQADDGRFATLQGPEEDFVILLIGSRVVIFCRQKLPPGNQFMAEVGGIVVHRPSLLSKISGKVESYILKVGTPSCPGDRHAVPAFLLRVD